MRIAGKGRHIAGPSSYRSPNTRFAGWRHLLAGTCSLWFRPERMRERFIGVFMGLVGMAIALPAPAQADSAELPTLLFLGVTTERGVSEEVGAIVERLFLERVRSLGRFQVGSRAELNELLDAQATQQMLGCEDDEGCLSEVGASVNADWMVSGNLSRVGEEFLLSFKLYDVELARATRQLSEQIENDEQLLADAVPPAATLLLTPPLSSPLEDVRPPPPTPFYKNPLVLGGAGVAVAATVVAILVFQPQSIRTNLGPVTLDGPQ